MKHLKLRRPFANAISLIFLCCSLGYTVTCNADTCSGTAPVAGSGVGYVCKGGKWVPQNVKDDKADTDECQTPAGDAAAQQACQSAVNTCNMISPQTGMLIQQALTQAKTAMTSSMPSTDPVTLDKSAASSCKIGAAMAGIAGAGTLTLALLCETKVAKCKSQNNPTKQTADVETEDVEIYKHNYKTCGALDANWVMDGLQALTYFANYEQNSQCAAFYTQAAKDAVPKTCQEEPTRPDCICVINPNDPSCLGQNAGLAAATGFTDSTLRSGNVGDPTAGLNFGTDPVGAPPGAGGAGGGLPGAGGGAGGPSLLGGKPNPDEPGGSGAGPYNTNVISGTTSGSGGPPSSRGGGSGGDGNSSLLSALANKFNLKKYLPGGQARGLASTGADGMTGANGPSIWDKVSTQYNRKKGEMVP